MAANRVVVTGLGAITPIGNTVPEYWEGLVTGRSGGGPITRFDPAKLKTRIAAEVKGYSPEAHFDKKAVRRLDLFVQYAIVAANEAVKMAGLDLDKSDRDRIGCIVGTGIGGLEFLEEQHIVFLKEGSSRVSPLLVPRMICNMAAGHVSMHLKLRGPNTCVVTACAAGSHAIGDAFRQIQFGHADAMVAGGTESAITEFAFTGFEQVGALTRRNDTPLSASRPFSKTRDGFLMGEGSGMLLLESLEHAKARGAKILAEIVGYGMSADAYHITAPAPDGAGAALSMNRAIKDARVQPKDVDYINAHGTSTDMNDRIETIAIKSVFGEHAKDLPVSSNKSMTGHLLGGAGGVEAVASVMTIMNHMVPPTINFHEADPECDLDYVPNEARKVEAHYVLSNSFGFGGHNASLLFATYN